jgi:DNA polymerase-3 subunit gamma/tau
MTALPVKYRPKTLDEIVGHAEVVTKLKSYAKKKERRAFLFHGPAGTGKTTLARIIAKEYGCAMDYTMEVDAATNTGVDNIRDIQEVLRYLPMGGTKMRAVILDEAHMLSKAAWNSILKPLEEVPPHVVWFICTTEPDKVIKTVKERCAVFGLSPLSVVLLKKIINHVAKGEGIELKSDIIDLIAQEAGGSPRQAISFLEKCSEVSNVKEAAKLLASALESDATIELCRFLVSGGNNWSAAMEIVAKFKSEQPEGIRIVVCNYMGKVLQGTKNGKQAAHLLNILEAFEGTYNQSEKMAPLLLSLGRVLLQ